jgi:hypothetical protein
MPSGIQGIPVVPPAQPRSNNEQLGLASVGCAEVRSEPHYHGDNGWTWKPFWDEYAKLHEKYFDLVNFNSGRDIPNLGGAP